MKVKDDKAHEDAVRTLENNMEAMGMEEDLNIEYDRDIASNDLFWALVSPIDRETRPETPEKQAGWMDASKACSLIDGSAVNLSGLADWLNKVDLEAKQA